MTKKMILGDIVTVWLMLSLCIILPLFLNVKNKDNNTVFVSVGKEVTHEISLDEDVVFSPDGGHTYIAVSEGFAYISSSDCPDGLCMKMKKADKNGGSVVCLPNRVSVSVKSNGAEGGADVEVG